MNLVITWGLLQSLSYSASNKNPSKQLFIANQNDHPSYSELVLNQHTRW